MILKPGWLKRQLENVTEDVRGWPAWMHRAAGFEEDTKMIARRLTKFQISLLREAKNKGVFSSYMVPNKSIAVLVGLGLVAGNKRADYFKTTRHFSLTASGEQYLKMLDLEPSSRG